MDYLEYLAFIEAFGKADGSTAWCVNQANVFASRSAVMPEPLAQEIFSDERSGRRQRSPDCSRGPSCGRRVPSDRTLAFQQRLPSRKLDGRHRICYRHRKSTDVSDSEG